VENIADGIETKLVKDSQNRELPSFSIRKRSQRNIV
jgi:hypothetical protein